MAPLLVVDDGSDKMRALCAIWHSLDPHQRADAESSPKP
jgi:hypothetical protein